MKKNVKIYDFFNNKFSIEISTGYNNFKFSINILDIEKNLLISCCIPGFSLYFSIKDILSRDFVYNLCKKYYIYEGLETGISIYDYCIYFNFLHNSESDNNFFQKFYYYFDILNFFLGKEKYSSQTYKELDIIIPMKEKNYKGIIKIFTSYWKRPRWFKKSLKRFTIDIPEGIPHPGKGTSEFNCNEDRTYSLTAPYTSVLESINKFKNSVNYCRNNYPL